MKLQKDIDRLGSWARKGGMRFQPVKCNMMQLVTGQLVPESTRTQVNSYPFWSTRTHFGQLVPELTRTRVNSYPF